MKCFKALLTVALLFSGASQASMYCNENGSSNEILTPMFLTGGTYSGYLFITNVSEHPVTVKWNLADASGNAFTPTDLLYAAKFSAGNTPVNASGATLQPGEMGEIVVLTGVNGRVNVGKLSWHSTACMQSALMANYLNELTESSRYSATAIPLNAGKAF